MISLHEGAATRSDGYRDTTPKALADAVDAVRIVDVREPHEYTGELGHIKQAELVPLAGVETAAKGWNKDQELVLVCRSGARSGRAAAMLATMGFGKVMNMVGGMIAWNEAGLPVER